MTDPLRASRPRPLAVAGLCAGQFISTLSTTVIATALPTIAGELGGQSQLAWAASAALLSATVAGPVMGKLADVLGHRSVFLATASTYAIGAIIAGSSSTTWQLITGLATQGLGIGGLMVMTQVILADLTTPRERGRYIGFIASAFGIAAMTGPLIGGYLVTVGWLGWRLCFFGTLPIIVIVCLLVMPTLRRSRVHRRKVDYVGMGSLTVATSCLLAIVTFAGRELSWLSWATIALVLVMLTSLVMLFMAERRVTDPALPVHMLRSSVVRSCIAMSMLTSGIMYVSLFLLPQYLQIARGSTPSHSGVLLLPLLVGQVVSTLVVGRRLARHGRWKPFLLAGTLSIAFGVGSFALVPGPEADIVLPLAMIAIGAGLGSAVQILMTVAQSMSGPDDMGATTSLITFARSLGSSLGVAFVGAITNWRVTQLLPEALKDRGASPSLAERLGTPMDIAAGPRAVREAVSSTYAAAFHDAFTFVLPLAVLAPLLAFRLKSSVLSDGTESKRIERTDCS